MKPNKDDVSRLIGSQSWTHVSAGEPTPDQPVGDEFHVISEHGVGIGRFADNGNDIELRQRSDGNSLIALVTERVFNVRYGPVEGEQGWVLFDFLMHTPTGTRTARFRMPDPYPEVITGSEDTVAAKRLCVRAILNGRAEEIC